MIDGFDREKSEASLIAVTTQVAEMSLDLDADILISEIAPVPSMIQRLGRLNRRINLENRGTPRRAYFLTPEKPRWELEKDLTAADKLLILNVCDKCEQRTLSLSRPESWTEAGKRFDFA